MDGWNPQIDGPYGTEKIFTPGKRRRMNLLAIGVNVFLPWILFCGIYTALCFTLHYTRPHVAEATIFIGLLASAFSGALAFKAKARDSDPMWFTFSALAFFIATLLAAIFGDLNYWMNMQPFYDLDNLNSYFGVNPATAKGQEKMDAGRIVFKEGTELDLRKSIGFKNENLYCVTPITHGMDQLASYDFWAVGINCCQAVGDFKCGEVGNPHAHAALRSMRDEDRPLYRLAVQMAEAEYNIKATHPLFFHWMQAPSAAINRYRDDGFRYFGLGCACHFLFNAVCVTAAVCGFSRIRTYGYY